MNPPWLTPIKLGLIGFMVGTLFCLLSVAFESCQPLRTMGMLLVPVSFGYLLAILR